MIHTSCEMVTFDSVNRSLTLESTPIPDLKEGEILIRNEMVTLCKSDLNTYSGKRTEKNPTILGHEIVGRIEDIHPSHPGVDELNQPLRKGDRVTWAIFASEPDSFYTRIGIPQKGPGLFKYGHEQLTQNNTLHGGLAQFTILRNHTPVIRIDESIPVSVVAPVNCAVATVAGAIRVAGDLANKRVLIIGAGMLGVMACAMASTQQAKSVSAADISEDRLTIAGKFGASHTYLMSKLTHPDHPVFDVVFDFSGMPESMELALWLLDIGGTTVWIGATFPQREVAISAEKLIRNVHTIKGLHNYNRDDLVSAVRFISQHFQQFPFESLIEDRFNLHQAREAFDYAISKNPFRVGIRL